MSNRLHFARRLFLVLGWTGIVLGLGVGLYSLFVLRPRVAALTNEINRSLASTTQALSALKGQRQVLTSAISAARQGTDIVQLLPSTIRQLQKTLFQTSRLLVETGQVATEITGGISGLLAPEEELKETATDAERTAYELRQLARNMEKLRKATSDLGTPLAETTRKTKQLVSELEPTRDLIVRAENRLQSIQSAVDRLALPAHVALGVVGVGGLYLFLGLISLSMAISMKEVASASERRTEEPRKVA